MILGLLPITLAAIEAAYATRLLHGWRRRDNRMFGAIVLIDAALIAWRGLNALTGSSLAEPIVVVPCVFGLVVLALLVIEFLSAFPRRPAMRWRWRAALLAWGAAGAALAAAQPMPPARGLSAVELAWFWPATILAFTLGLAAFRSTAERDARLVIAVVGFRHAFSLAVYEAGPALGVLEAAMWAEITLAALVGITVLGTTVLRGDLFSIRSSLAEQFARTTAALLVLIGGGGVVFAALRYVAPGPRQLLAVVSAAFVPLGLAAIGSVVYPRVERRVLAGLDERRARRLGVEGEPLPADADAAIAEASQRIASIGEGTAARWVPAGDLPPALAEQLGPGEPLRRRDQAALPAALIVPAFGADRVLVGAFYLDGGRIDRDTYVIARDLAARVALAIQRAEAVSELDEARQLAALGQFAAAIAHDIRTPLTSISLNVQILRRKLQLPDDDREHLDIALEELARLDHSVAEILEFAKPVKLTRERIDVTELIETTRRNLTPLLSGRGVAVRVEPAAAIDTDDALTVQGDAQRLRQVLINLVDNAANASAPGTEVTLRAQATPDRHVAIEIEDRGRGIGPDDMPRIFEPFFTTRPDGTGLGLAIVHKVVRAHGGDIKVRSTPGGGSTFTITLPQLS